MRSDSNNYLFDNGNVTIYTIAREGHPRLLYGYDSKGNQFQVRFPHGFTVTTPRSDDSIRFVYRAVRGAPLTAQIRVGRVRTVNDVIRTYRKLVNLVFDINPRLYDLEQLGSSNGNLLVPRPGLPPLVRMYHNDQRYKIYDPFQKRDIYVGLTNSPNIKRIVKERSRELMTRINQHRITRRDVFPASLQSQEITNVHNQVWNPFTQVRTHVGKMGRPDVNDRIRVILGPILKEPSKHIVTRDMILQSHSVIGI